MKTKFLFDLDGTLTREETLPLIGAHFGIEGEIRALTEETVRGAVPFPASLTARVMALGAYPIDEIAGLLERVPLHEPLVSFLQARAEAAAIVTGNLDVWTARLLRRIGCRAYTSRASVEAGRVTGIAAILDKRTVVRHYQAEGARVVFVGDGANDLEALEAADIAIGAGLTHPPAAPVLAAAHRVFYEPKEMCAYLEKLSEGKM